MFAITLKNFGGPEVLTLSQIPKPYPGPTQLLVRVKAAALNRADLLQRRGKHPPPLGESDVPGLEIAGVVEEMGSKVTGFNLKEAVFGLVGGGGYAEYCLIDYKVAMPIPKNLSFIEAASIPEAFLTASEAIFSLGKLRAKQSILIHAGGSGVGTAGIQLAHSLPANIFTTVGSDEKGIKLKNLGAGVVVNYKKQNFALQIKKSLDVIIDFIGATNLDRNMGLLKTGGRLIQVGLMGGAKTEINLELLMRKRLQLKGLVMRTRSIRDKRVITKRFKKKWLPRFADHTLKPIIDSVYPLSEVQAAHQRMEDNANFGKIILQLD